MTKLKKQMDAEMHQNKTPILEIKPTKGLKGKSIEELTPLEPAITAGSLVKILGEMSVLKLITRVSNSRSSIGVYSLIITGNTNSS
jgi:hypothetical protein